jgi:hypothetical protein
MGTGTAQIKAPHRCAVVSPPSDWPEGEQLVERHVAVQRMTSGHPEKALEV